MNRSTIDIDQMLRRRGGKLLYEGPDGRVAQCPDGLILSDITSGKALCGCLSFLLLPFNVYASYYCQSTLDSPGSMAVSVFRGILLSGALIMPQPTKAIISNEQKSGIRKGSNRASTGKVGALLLSVYI